MPFAFTEQGVAMLASVLNSPKAIQVNISIVRAFVMLRQLALTYKELAEKIGKLERKYNKNLPMYMMHLTFCCRKKKIMIIGKQENLLDIKKLNELTMVK